MFHLVTPTRHKYSKVNSEPSLAIPIHRSISSNTKRLGRAYGKIVVLVKYRKKSPWPVSCFKSVLTFSRLNSLSITLTKSFKLFKRSHFNYSRSQEWTLMDNKINSSMLMKNVILELLSFVKNTFANSHCLNTNRIIRS